MPNMFGMGGFGATGPSQREQIRQPPIRPIQGSPQFGNAGIGQGPVSGGGRRLDQANPMGGGSMMPSMGGFGGFGGPMQLGFGAPGQFRGLSPNVLQWLQLMRGNNVPTRPMMPMSGLGGGSFGGPSVY